MTNTSHVLADDVADLALWLTMGLVRRLCEADRFVREGARQNTSFPLTRSMRGLKTGILGLGHIGAALAARLELLGGEIGYHGRRRKPQVSYRYFDDLERMAEWCHVLAVSCPATKETENLVGVGVLRALGGSGILINIARGSVVEEQALVSALGDFLIGGAGLDVFANEPHVPDLLAEHPRVITLPHIGSATIETRHAMGQAMIGALRSHFRPS
ncbi:NAD(P)-dependent oxidoreductase [Chelativorans sp. AA-79]|uniref:NAD(P)-dependent oxidoreductase n=1 Tax=Chelativorans sp. AA-79 TaxID=3028735 RepID=UPI0023F74912|nr:NAD(P)-dependent oxidoreductase [Chelativorans sp. AA-79]WEX12264.1 NAD(P)-dependent oxidoreductase [Chelativorans sp. AA-79]